MKLSSLKNKHEFLQKALAPESLRFQLLSRSLFFLAIILLFIGMFQYVFMREFIYTHTASNVKSQILTLPREAWAQMLLYSELNQNGITGQGQNTPEDSNRIPFVLFDSTIAFVGPNGNVAVISNNMERAGAAPQLDKQEYQDALQPETRQDYRVVTASDGDEKLVILNPVESRGYIVGLIQVSLSTKPLKVVLFRQLMIFLLLSLFALIGGLIAYWSVIKRTLAPLSNIVDTVEQIDAGNLADRLPAEQGQTEIDRLAISFNGMLERLESSFEAEKEAKEQMRRFVADASHELRTPLTSIHGFLEVLLRGAMNQPDKLNKSLNSMHAESERMKKLVQDLLLLAKLDRSPKMEFKEKEFDGLLLEMESQLGLLAGNREVILDLAPEQRACIDVDKMKQVILNLFHNAVQHTDPEEGRIELILKPSGQGVELTVKDNGAGIAEEHIPHLFERFYRSDSSRTRRSGAAGGAGLGLAITQTLIALHGGTIQVESQVGAGSSFIVWIPREQAERD